jgi:hypothetical protein
MVVGHFEVWNVCHWMIMLHPERLETVVIMNPSRLVLRVRKNLAGRTKSYLGYVELEGMNPAEVYCLGTENPVCERSLRGRAPQ